MAFISCCCLEYFLSYQSFKYGNIYSYLGMAHGSENGRIISPIDGPASPSSSLTIWSSVYITIISMATHIKIYYQKVHQVYLRCTWNIHGCVMDMYVSKWQVTLIPILLITIWPPQVMCYIIINCLRMWPSLFCSAPTDDMNVRMVGATSTNHSKYQIQPNWYLLNHFFKGWQCLWC